MTTFEDIVREYLGGYDGDLDCADSVAEFRALCGSHGYSTRAVKLVAAPTASDPLQGDHYVTVVNTEHGEIAIDWTSRQFATIEGADVHYRDIPEPLTWAPTPDAATTYPLKWVEFVPDG